MLARCFASTLGAVALSISAQGAVIELSATRDTTLYESATGALGNGSGQFFFAGSTNQPQARRALLAFDAFAALPEGATILSATLRLHVASTSTSLHSFSLHRMTSNWTEGASDASGNEGSGTTALVGDATWIHASYPGTFWSTPGGDFDTALSATALVGDVGYYSWTSDQLRIDVQSWLSNPQSAMGWLLMGDESAPGTTRRFDSSESLDAALRPQLVIEYAAVPAPGSLALLGLSLIVARRRRR